MILLTWLIIMFGLLFIPFIFYAFFRDSNSKLEDLYKSFKSFFSSHTGFISYFIIVFGIIISLMTINQYFILTAIAIFCNICLIHMYSSLGSNDFLKKFNDELKENFYKVFEMHRNELFIEDNKIKVKKDSIICFDIETTGLNTEEKDEVLSITIINGNKEVLFDSLIKPYNKKRWTEATKINDIRPKDVMNSPLLDEVSYDVAQIFKKATLIIGYNIHNFDIPFLKNRDSYLDEALSINYPLYVDLIDFIKEKIKKDRVSLNECCNYYDVINETPHVGMSDCEATIDCFYEMLKNGDVYIYDYKLKKYDIELI